MDDHDIDRLDDDDDEPVRRPLLSFDHGSSLPHWSDPPTGELPIIGSMEQGPAPVAGSRLFPQLPDDPNLTISGDDSPRLTTGIDLGGSLADGIDDLAPTGPIESIVPQIPVDELPAPRWGAAETNSAESGHAEAASISEAADVEPSFDGALGIPALDALPSVDDIDSDGRDLVVSDGPAHTTGPISTDAFAITTQGPRPMNEFDDDLDALLDRSDDVDVDEGFAAFGTLDDVDNGDDAVDIGSIGQRIPDGIVHPSSGPAPADRPDVALVRPISSAPSAESTAATSALGAAASGRDDDDLRVWNTLDEQAPLWREGAQDWDDTRDRGHGAERTVLHFDDVGPPNDGQTPPPPPSGGRNVPMAVATAIGLIAAFLVLASRGPGWAMLLVVPLLVVAASEFFVSVRKVGYRPATLLGLTSTAMLSIGAYYRGDGALPLILVMTVMVGLLWYLFGVESDRPTANLSVTIFGVMWVGLLGAYATLILVLPSGSGILFGAIIGTATYDTAGLFIGRWTGQSRLAPSISPNKTWEGLIGGMIFAVLVVTFLLGVRPGLHPWSASEVDALLLGVVVAFIAPLGDLVQSLIKRDLGVKDMGTVLPGHGGVFDRFDAMLFVLPAVYYLALARDLHLAV